jgi:hypothetical protein
LAKSVEFGRKGPVKGYDTNQVKNNILSPDEANGGVL